MFAVLGENVSTDASEPLNAHVAVRWKHLI